MLSHVARYWWLFVLRGACSVAFGIAAFAWPGIAFTVLVLLFGAYMLVDGVVALASAIRFRHERERWLPLVVEAIAGIAVGIITFGWTAIAAFAWVYTIGAWAVVTGLLAIVTATRMKGALGAELMLGLTAVLSIALGVAFFVFPLAGLVGWTWLIGAYAIAGGALLIAAGLRLRRVAPNGAVPVAGAT